MQGFLKTLITGSFVLAMMSLMAGCNTVSGTLHGVGKDVNAVAGTVAPKQNTHNAAHHHKAKVKKQTTTTTTTTQESNMNNMQ